MKKRSVFSKITWNDVVDAGKAVFGFSETQVSGQEDGQMRVYTYDDLPAPGDGEINPETGIISIKRIPKHEVPTWRKALVLTVIVVFGVTSMVIGFSTFSVIKTVYEQEDHDGDAKTPPVWQLNYFAGDMKTEELRVDFVRTKNKKTGEWEADESRPVQSIKDFGVANNTYIKRIYIGAKVEHIGRWALVNCEKLTEIIVDEANPFFVAVDGVLYNKERTALLAYPMGLTESRFVVPEGVTEIGEAAFYNNVNLPEKNYLHEVVLPQGLRKIGDFAFFGAVNLERLELPNTLQSLGQDSLSKCRSLGPVYYVPQSVKNLGKYAFYECTGIQTLVFAHQGKEVNFANKKTQAKNLAKAKQKLQKATKTLEEAKGKFAKELQAAQAPKDSAQTAYEEAAIELQQRVDAILDQKRAERDALKEKLQAMSEAPLPEDLTEEEMQAWVAERASEYTAGTARIEALENDLVLLQGYSVDDLARTTSHLTEAKTLVDQKKETLQEAEASNMKSWIAEAQEEYDVAGRELEKTQRALALIAGHEAELEATLAKKQAAETALDSANVAFDEVQKNFEKEQKQYAKAQNKVAELSSQLRPLGITYWDSVNYKTGEQPHRPLTEVESRYWLPKVDKAMFVSNYPELRCGLSRSDYQELLLSRLRESNRQKAEEEQKRIAAENGTAQTTVVTEEGA